MQKRVRVLIVDEHERVRHELVSKLCRDQDLEIVGATADPEEASRWSDERDPDVVLLDLKRGDRAGVDLVRRLKHGPNDPAVLILTSYVSRDEWLRAEEAGACAYLLKQIDSRGLVDKIKALAHAS